MNNIKLDKQYNLTLRGALMKINLGTFIYFKVHFCVLYVESYGEFDYQWNGIMIFGIFIVSKKNWIKTGKILDRI